MLTASYQRHNLHFNFDASTSRGKISEHIAYYLQIWDSSNPTIVGIGEAAPLGGLSIDFRDDFEQTLAKIVRDFENFNDAILEDFPCIRFALETAYLDLENGGIKKIADTDFYKGTKVIPINGLIWMAEKEIMIQEVRKKIKAGFDVIKLKVGALDFKQELSLLKEIRREYSPNDITIRLDANGAFSQKDAFEKLKILSDFDIHSIEQPIKPKQAEAMAELCNITPIPIVLDEELIGKYSQEEKFELLYLIKPQFLIFKPTLLGGFSATDEWIMLAENLNIPWWITSALESNIGLNAIAQYTSKFDTDMAHGLGTGSLYSNNIASPLEIIHGTLRYNSRVNWGEI